MVIKKMTNQAGGDFEKALRKRLPVEYFVRCALTTFRQNPRLLQCHPDSLIYGMLEAAQFGLEIDGVLGHAFLVPYGSEAKFLPGYKGFIKLALESPSVRKFVGHAVYEADEFDLEYGNEERLVHRPHWKTPERGALLGTYAVAKLENGEHVPRFLPIDQIEKIRQRALSNKKRVSDSPWNTDFEPMAIKTAVRAAFKWLPLTSEAQRLAALDEQVEAGVAPREPEFEVKGDGDPVEVKDELDEVADTLKETAAASSASAASDEEQDPEPLLPPEGWAHAWDSTKEHGGYPYDVRTVEPWERWKDKGIGGRTNLKGLAWGILEARTAEHAKLREVVDKMADKARAGESIPMAAKYAAVRLRMLDDVPPPDGDPLEGREVTQKDEEMAEAFWGDDD